jgi:mRNA interferase MazF
VYRFNLDPTVGSEIRKTRPCVIVQRDVATQSSPLTVICPITDANGRSGNTLNPSVPAGIGGTSKDSRVVCQHVRVADKSRVIGEKLGTLPPEIMSAVSRGLKAILDL